MDRWHLARYFYVMIEILDKNDITSRVFDQEISHIIDPAINHDPAIIEIDMFFVLLPRDYLVSHFSTILIIFIKILS